jgi:hypothetical protein
VAKVGQTCTAERNEGLNKARASWVDTAKHHFRIRYFPVTLASRGVANARLTPFFCTVWIACHGDALMLFLEFAINMLDMPPATIQQYGKPTI